MTGIAPLGKKPTAVPAEAAGTMIESAVKIVIDALEEKGVRKDYIVLVGGGPFNERSALAVGADSYCRDTSKPV